MVTVGIDNIDNRDTMANTLHEINEKPDIFGAYYTAIEALRYIKSFNQDNLFTGSIGITTAIRHQGKARGDTDNFAKAVADSLQGVAYKDDKQVESIIGYRDTDEGRGVLRKQLRDLDL